MYGLVKGFVVLEGERGKYLTGRKVAHILSAALKLKLAG